MWEERLVLYDQFVEQCPRFERKGKTMPYTSANGHMFSLLNKAGEFGIRFAKERQQEFIETHNTTTYQSYGATMRGYVLIPDAMLTDHALMAELLNESYDYVMGLAPK